MPKKRKTMKKKMTQKALEKKLKSIQNQIKKQKAKMRNMGIPVKSKVYRQRKYGKGSVIKIDNMQTPKSRTSVKADKQRKALPPGRRVSRTGNRYTEHRQNRSDKRGTRL